MALVYSSLPCVFSHICRQIRQSVTCCNICTVAKTLQNTVAQCCCCAQNPQSVPPSNNGFKYNLFTTLSVLANECRFMEQQFHFIHVERFNIPTHVPVNISLRLRTKGLKANKHDHCCFCCTLLPINSQPIGQICHLLAAHEAKSD